VKKIKGSYKIPTSIESGKYKLKVEVQSINGLIYTSKFVDIGEDKVIEFSNPNQLTKPEIVMHLHLPVSSTASTEVTVSCTMHRRGI